jgi:hypothetical protein
LNVSYQFDPVSTRQGCACYSHVLGKYPYGRISTNKIRLTQDIMNISHPGPFLAHLSKVPDGQDVHMYDGSGDWVKICTLGLEMTDNAEYPVHWLPDNEPSYYNDTNSHKLPERVRKSLTLPSLSRQLSAQANCCR